MRKIGWLTITMSFFVLHNACANEMVPAYITANVPDAQISGTARAEYLMFDLYDLKLYQSQEGRNTPLALSLTYLRAIDGAAIIDRTIEIIRNQGFSDEIKLAAWHDRLNAVFPDVEEGTVLTGVLNSANESLFYKDGVYIGKITDPQFGSVFFNIWLGENPGEPVVWQLSPRQL